MRTLAIDNTGICADGETPSTEGIKGIGSGLSMNKTLIHLDIANNKIDAGGISHISKALGANTTLKEINFSYNPIGIEGLACVFNALKTNTRTAIAYMWMRNTNPNPAQETAYQQNLAKFVSRVPSITSLFYGINVPAIDTALTSNRNNPVMKYKSRTKKRSSIRL